MNVREPLVELSVRYATTLFPFRVESLIAALPHLGFVVAEGVKEPRFTGRLGISAQVGTKGDLVSWVNTERNSLGVRGTEFEAVVQDFDAIEELIQHRLGVASQGNVAFYELQARALFESSGQHPITAIERHFDGMAAIGKFASVLNRPVSNLGFRLVPLGWVPTPPRGLKSAWSQKYCSPTSYTTYTFSIEILPVTMCSRLRGRAFRCSNNW